MLIQLINGDIPLSAQQACLKETRRLEISS